MGWKFGSLSSAWAYSSSGTGAKFLSDLGGSQFYTWGAVDGLLYQSALLYTDKV